MQYYLDNLLQCLIEMEAAYVPPMAVQSAETMPPFSPADREFTPVAKAEAASQNGLVQFVDDRTLISCQERPNSPETAEESARLNSLSDREYHVLQLRAFGLGYEKIAEDMGVSISTVRTHLGNVFEKICPSRHDSEEAVSLIPIAESDLQQFSLFRVKDTGETASKLSPAQEEICKLLMSGLSRQEIALKKGISASTVRTHVHDIYVSLGMDNMQETERPGLLLRRLAAGSVNLQRYYKMLAKMGSGLQPKVVSMLGEQELISLQQRTDALLDSPKGREMLSATLTRAGYASPEESDNGLPLTSLVAAGLILNEGYRDVMLHHQTTPIAQVIIERETEHYLQGQQERQWDM